MAFGAPVLSGAEATGLQGFAKIRSDPDLQAQAREVVAGGMEQAFGEDVKSISGLAFPFNARAPVFVTLKKGEKVRGCMGTLQAREPTLAQEIQANLRKALFQDPWHRRVTREEIPGMEVYLTAIGLPIPVRGIGEISPARDGVLIRQGRREAVALPGEAKTQRYLLTFLKAKAGIQQGPYQIFRFKTETIRVESGFAQMSKSS
jgi:AMMECR1 domain-containing protein